MEPYKLMTSIPVSQESIDDSRAFIDRLHERTASMINGYWMRTHLGDTWEPALTMADEVALLELGPLDTSDQPERIVHDDCETCECYGWSW